MAKTNAPKKTIFMKQGDWSLLKELQEKLPDESDSEIYRLGLKALNEKVEEIEQKETDSKQS